MKENPDEAARLRRALRQVEELTALAEAGELLDASLDHERLVRRALGLALRVMRADGALLVTQREQGETAHFLLRGEAEARGMALDSSRLTQRVLLSGERGVQRDPNAPGARASARILGSPPAVRIAVPLKRLDRVLGSLEVAFREEPPPRVLGSEGALAALADHLAVALDNARLARDLERRIRELSLLRDIGTKISAQLDLDELLDAILDALEELVPSNASGIFLIRDETREIRREKLRGYAPERFDEVRLKVGHGILGWVADRGEGVAVGDVHADPRYVNARKATRSEMAIPIRTEGRVIGILNLESDDAAAYGTRDLDRLVAFADQAAISIGNARMYAEVRKKRALEEELRVARHIHRTLLPHTTPAVEGHTLAGRNDPSSDVGGDYFDFLPMENGRWAVLIADVSGHGIPASLIMAGFRAEVRAAFRISDDPRRVLSVVNRSLAAELDADRFVTALVSVYDPATGTLVYSNAGHEPGLVVRRDGSVDSMEAGGLLLGAFPEAEYERGEVHLGAGDRVLLFTDGLIDDPRGDGASRGTEELLRLAKEHRNLPAAELPDRILREMEPAQLTGGGPRGEDADIEADDRTLVILAKRNLTGDRAGEGAAPPG
ncbi:MAG: SpoIIE family protein phosphatase [Gemmatimonadota bacterium]|nr:SpoIIE family protein phosphatase [Gemmatimonadota bacterium]MDP6529956.1 SpoIIE family protein phosphatase [Gemmatimonadota bacterium]MDP6802139.1 SpoIIE family protein phosphatase [Gemmatimonadota bacterium]MDP7032074.1 SpoIIE family protein phosphatase [Gemmatimonadota bacterium]